MNTDYSELSICIPVYNEGAVVGSVITKVLECFSKAEIIVVDDGSTDDTFDVLSEFKNIILLKHTRNIGYGASLKTAMRKSSRSNILWMDSDGQHRIEDVKLVADRILMDDSDAVLGVRGKDSNIQHNRQLGKRVLNFIAQLVARDNIPDLNTGLRAFRRNVILRYLHLLPDGFSASTTSTLVMMKRRYSINYVNIVTESRVGHSTVKIFNDGIRTLHLLIRILILFDAFYFFSIISFFVIMVSIIYGGYVALTLKIGLPVLAATGLISGVMTFFMGLICDQIVALRIERLENSEKE